jgi:hypothetical protein
MNAAQLINQSSSEVEWYTPKWIIEAAREVMDGIALDPASSDAANKIVGASRYFTKEENGLRRMWCAESVWVNWPFGRVGNPIWVQKIEREYVSCRSGQICCICYACTSEAWFQPLAVFPQCFLTPRTNYLLPNGKKKPGVTKGSVVTYLGPRVKEFAEMFRRYGVIKVSY